MREGEEHAAAPLGIDTDENAESSRTTTSDATDLTPGPGALDTQTTDGSETRTAAGAEDQTTEDRTPTAERPNDESADTRGTPETDAHEVREPVDGVRREDRRRLRRGWLSGAVPVLSLYTWVITAGRADFLQRRFFDDFFDAQGRALAHGRLNVPADVAGIEGFLVGGKTYIYFGPFPALIRMPVLAVTDSFDGRLTGLSMLAAMVVLTLAAFRLTCAIRAAVRGSAPVERREVVAYAGLAVAALAAPPFFLASATIAYHEAAIWGVALSVAGFDAVVRWQLEPTTRRLAGACVLIALALLSRQAVALGPLAALALAGTVSLVRSYREQEAEPETVRRLRTLVPTAVPLAAALLLALAPSVAVHYAKFGQLFGVPFDQQVFTQPQYAEQNQQRMEALEGSSTLQGIEYLSTTTWQYFRPDALDLRPDFPWIDFPRGGPTLVNEDAAFDTLDWSSSLPTTTPALTMLGLAGAVWLVRRRTDRARRVGEDGQADAEEPTSGAEEPTAGADEPTTSDATEPAAGHAAEPASNPARPGRVLLFPLVVGAAAGGIGVLTFAYVAHRYVSDLYPLALVGGLVGFHMLLGASRDWPRTARRWAGASLAVLVVAGLAVNLALAIEYQRERGHAVPQEWHAELVRWRDRLPGSMPQVHVDENEPQPPVTDGTLLVVGDCDRLYAGVRDRWLLVEEGPDGNTCRRVAD